MSRLLIDVDDDARPPLVQMSVDGRPVGLVQSMHFEANEHGVRLVVTLPDATIGWHNAELVSKLPYAQAILAPVEGEVEEK